MQLLEGIIYLTSTIHEVKWVCERPEKLGCSQKRERYWHLPFSGLCVESPLIFLLQKKKKKEKKKTYIWHIFE